MRLVFIYGLPATGKLTVAQELVQLTGYKLFHNHLVVDLLLSTFEFGSVPFVALREEIWLSVFQRACEAGLPGLIFTFNPESSVKPQFAERVVEVVAGCGGTVEFVELVCPLDELMERMDGASRVQYRKLSSRELFAELHAKGVFDSSHMPEAKLTIDTSSVEPMDAARRIVDVLRLV